MKIARDFAHEIPQTLNTAPLPPAPNHVRAAWCQKLDIDDDVGATCRIWLSLHKITWPLRHAKPPVLP